MAADTFDRLLAVGMARPVCPAGLVEQVVDTFTAACAPVADVWPESSLFLSKSSVVTLAKCEGLLMARRAQGFSDTLPVPAAVGQVTHRAIQVTHTHPGLSPAAAARAAVSACRQDVTFEQFWSTCGDGVQSDVLSAAVVRLTSFLDSWPPLDDTWVPRFEQPLSVRTGAVTLSGRPDLTLGRPRGDGRATMLLCDFKSGPLSDEHILEADFYALLCVLRLKVVPFRSFVYSLESGEFTPPDIDGQRLLAAAATVGQLACAAADALSETRAPVLTAGTWCRWCPAASTCPANNVEDDQSPPPAESSHS